jgi:hypothetical protein
MIGKLIEWVTGKDDLERIAYRNDVAQLNQFLKSRPVMVPQRPRRFLDAASMSAEQLLEQTRLDLEQLNSVPFEPWILNTGGKRRLPVFSSEARAGAFSERISREMNKVFSLGCITILLDDMLSQIDVDFVDLNLFSKKSWEIDVAKRS